MEKVYSIKHTDGITEIKIFQNFNLDQGKEILDDIEKNYPYARRLWDFSVVVLKYSMDDIKSVAEYSKKLFTKPNKTAFYTLSDLTFGEMRQLAVYREEEGKTSARAFRDKQEAIDWLNS